MANDDLTIPSTEFGVLWVHSHDIAISSETVTTTRPRCPFLPEHLLIPYEAAEGLMITEIRVGNRHQLVTTAGVSASAFSGYSVDLSILPSLRRASGPHRVSDRTISTLARRLHRIHLEAISVDQDLLLTLRPTDPANHVARPFEAFFFGKMIGSVESR